MTEKDASPTKDELAQQKLIEAHALLAPNKESHHLMLNALITMRFDGCTQRAICKYIVGAISDGIVCGNWY